MFAKANRGLFSIVFAAVLSIPVSALVKRPFWNRETGTEFTGVSFTTFVDNLFPQDSNTDFRSFRGLFGILFPATSGIFAGASMSGDLRNPSKAIPKGTLWAMLTTFLAYLLVILAMASSTTHNSFISNPNVISETNISAGVIFAGECAVTFFSALMGVIGSAKLLQALARDKLLPGLSIFGRGTGRGDEPVLAIFLTFIISQLALLADLNRIATFISMGYQVCYPTPSNEPTVFECTRLTPHQDDFLRNKSGLFLAQNWLRPKFSTRVQVLQLADRALRIRDVGCGYVLH
jgi:potassium/chloride transporter 9